MRTDLTQAMLFSACVQDGQVVLRSENDAAGQRAEATV